MIPMPEHLPLLAALREPATAHILFMVSLPLPAAECASDAFDALLHQLRRHGRRPWRHGSEAAGCTAPEAALLRLVAALNPLRRGEEASFLAIALSQWLVRPDGQRELARHGALLARALAAAEPDRRSGSSCSAASALPLA